MRKGAGMKTFLVTGGAGYIGSHTVRHLRERGYRCLVVDNLVYGHREAVGDSDFYHMDIGDEQALSALMRKNAVDAVIHFAAYTYVGESVTQPQKFYRNNVGGALSLLSAMLEAGVGNIIFSSTCATYGDPLYMPLDEAHPRKPVSPYGKTKFIIEQCLEDYHAAYGLQYMILRYFNAAGADPEGRLGESHTPETHLIPLVLKAAKGELPNIKVFGTDYDTPDGTCIRDYIHVDDLAAAHRLSAEHLHSGGESRCLNLGTGQGHSVLEVIEAVRQVTGAPAPVEYAPRRAGDPPVLFAANAEARAVLGWEPAYMDLARIVETAWRWERNKRF